MAGVLKRVLVTGGAGYLGHQLVPELLRKGYSVVVYDMLWFGCKLEYSTQCVIVHGDIRETKRLAAAMNDCDAVIHLACISNDPSSELDETLTRAINYDAFGPLVAIARTQSVERFIYVSSSSVYGISDAPDVREDHPLVPITLYNTLKAACEPVLFDLCYGGDMYCTVLRPSTLCGYSPRQRLDLAVNVLTNLAVNTGKITVYGGEQKRPNLHIDDMVDALITVLEAPREKVDRQTFNVGAGNRTIMQLAERVSETVEVRYGRRVPIEIAASVDPRSYQVNSDKIANVLGFKPKRKIENAIDDLCHAFRDGLIPNPMTDDIYYNVKRMRKVWEDLYKNAPPSTFDPTKGHLSEIDLIRAHSSVVS